MKIVPYRVLFEVDIDSDAGKRGKREYKYSKPTDEMLPVALSDDGTHYTVSTHDRGDSDDHGSYYPGSYYPGSYYQIAFRIEEAAPFNLEEISLHLDSSIYRHTGLNLETDLYCNPCTRLDLKTNLWYQRSKYIQDTEGNWRIVADNDRAALKVDCITTAGVFKVVVCVNNKPLPSFDMPWIYVLPSAISKTQYIGMLSDLIHLHEGLVHNPNSTVGIGTYLESQTRQIEQEIDASNSTVENRKPKTYLESQTRQIEQEIDASKRLLTAIKGAIRIPSEQQGKRYTKMHISKVKRFDSRVVREYIKSGMTGKVLGIEYYEEHDTYENRVIKHVLQQIKRQHQSGLTYPIEPDTDIQTATELELSRITESKNAVETGSLNKPRCYRWTCNPPRGGHHLEVKVDGNCVEMPDHAPFSYRDKKYIKLEFHASSQKEMIFYLQNLTACFSRINDKPTFHIECEITEGKRRSTAADNTVYTLIATHVVSMNGKTYQPSENDISDEQYKQEIQLLLGNHSEYRLALADGGFYIKEDNRKRYICHDSTEKMRMKKEIEANIGRNVKFSKAKVKLWQIEESLIALLSDKWFDGIADTIGISTIKLTPKFQLNPYYAEIYKLITERFSCHPILSSDFDINAFGVNSTQLVYEYWVFYKILNKLQALGFTFSNTQSLIEHFQELIQNRKTIEKKSGISIEASRSNGTSQIRIEVGYEKVFSSNKVTDDHRTIQRVPDYYLRVKSSEGSHWYFFDAKYKCFTANANDKEDSRISYRQEIYDVAVAKYIYDLGEIFKCEAEYVHDEIRGSYVIMANVDDSSSELAKNNRLFGDSQSILNTPIKKKNTDHITSTLIDNKNGLPAHRYGAIVLTQDNEKELTSLMQLIFEYLESNKQDKHPNLDYCWSCNSPNPVDREEQKTGRSTGTKKKFKYYVTCQTCKAFRVDNHCVSCGKSIIKHTMGNYHRWDDSVNNSQWGFLCPQCGTGVNGLSRRLLESFEAVDDCPF